MQKIKMSHNQEIAKQRDMNMKQVRVFFALRPKLVTICKDWKNKLVDSCFTEYRFFYQNNDSRQTNLDNFNYVTDLFGCKLTCLNIDKSSTSSLMPSIKSNCSKLVKLCLNFNEIENKHFDNCFSKMRHLEILIIRLECENSTLPMSLVKSLEKVCHSLTTFLISSKSKPDQLCPPDSSVSVFFPLYNTIMTTIVKMKNIKTLVIHLDHGVTDAFLIILINNAKQLMSLSINGSNITDKGIKALNNSISLEYVSFELSLTKSENKFITDESISSLFNEKLLDLNISYCVNVTNRAVIQLVQNVPSLNYLHVENTKVNSEICKEIAELKKSGKVNDKLLVSFKDGRRDGDITSC